MAPGLFLKRCHRTVQEGATMLYASPNTPGAKVQYKARYDKYIGGKLVAPL